MELSADTNLFDIKRLDDYNALNDSYLIRVRSLLDKVDSLLIKLESHKSLIREENEDIQQKLTLLGDRDETHKVDENYKAFKFCYIVDQFRQVPPKNEDVVLKKSFKIVTANCVGTSRWINQDIQNFVKSIEDAVLKNKCKVLTQRKERLLNKVTKNDNSNFPNGDNMDSAPENSNFLNAQGLNIVEATIEGIDQAVSIINNSHVTDYDMENLNTELDVDWYMVANSIGTKSIAQCKQLWHMYLKPSVNKQGWNPDETVKLKKLIGKHGGEHCTSWDLVAEELGTGRKPYQCLAHYQKHIKGINIEWSDTDNRKLLRLVRENSYGARILWTNIYQQFPNRNCLAIQKHYNKNLNPLLKSGKWDPVEDELLINAITKYGTLWSKVARCVPSRSDVQCRERYTNFLNPQLKFGNWAVEEDAQILRFVKANGFGNWGCLTRTFASLTNSVCGIRSDNQVIARCGVLLQRKVNLDQRDELQAALAAMEREFAPVYREVLAEIQAKEASPGEPINLIIEETPGTSNIKDAIEQSSILCANESPSPSECARTSHFCKQGSNADEKSNQTQAGKIRQSFTLVEQCSKISETVFDEKASTSKDITQLSVDQDGHEGSSVAGSNNFASDSAWDPAVGNESTIFFQQNKQKTAGTFSNALAHEQQIEDDEPLDFGTVDVDLLAKVLEKLRARDRNRWRTRCASLLKPIPLYIRNRRARLGAPKMRFNNYFYHVNPSDYDLIRYFKRKIFFNLYKSPSAIYTTTSVEFAPESITDNGLKGDSSLNWIEQCDKYQMRRSFKFINTLIKQVFQNHHKEQGLLDIEDPSKAICRNDGNESQEEELPEREQKLISEIQDTLLPPCTENMIAWANLSYLKFELRLCVGPTIQQSDIEAKARTYCDLYNKSSFLNNAVVNYSSQNRHSSFFANGLKDSMLLVQTRDYPSYIEVRPTIVKPPPDQSDFKMNNNNNINKERLSETTRVIDAFNLNTVDESEDQGTKRKIDMTIDSDGTQLDISATPVDRGTTSDNIDSVYKIRVKRKKIHDQNVNQTNSQKGDLPSTLTEITVAQPLINICSVPLLSNTTNLPTNSLSRQYLTSLRHSNVMPSTTKHDLLNNRPTIAQLVSNIPSLIQYAEAKNSFIQAYSVKKPLAASGIVCGLSRQPCGIYLGPPVSTVGETTDKLDRTIRVFLNSVTAATALPTYSTPLNNLKGHVAASNLSLKTFKDTNLNANIIDNSYKNVDNANKTKSIDLPNPSTSSVNGLGSNLTNTSTTIKLYDEEGFLISRDTPNHVSKTTNSLKNDLNADSGVNKTPFIPQEVNSQIQQKLNTIYNNSNDNEILEETVHEPEDEELCLPEMAESFHDIPKNKILRCLDQVRESPEYQKLKSLMRSMFLYPAALTKLPFKRNM